MPFSPAQLSNAELVEENRLPACSDHHWYKTPQEWEGRNSSYEWSLNGLWKFSYAHNPSQVIPGFESPTFDCAGWDDMRVPGHIQLQGYDIPQYVNTQYPWDGNQDVHEGQAPTSFNPVACYVKTFVPPSLGEGERLVVEFAGAESALAVWLNGTYIGYATDTFTPSRFDLTDALVPGENKLAVQVFKWWAGSWLEDQDFYRFSGLFRDVTLKVIPSAHVQDIHVRTDCAEDFSTAHINVATTLHGRGSVSVTLEGIGKLEQVSPGYFTITIPQPRLWSPEDPYLYQLLFTVRDEAGEITEFIPQSVGIRRFGIEDGLLKLNGKRVVFNGVNRHEFGLNGRVMTREQTEADLRALKKTNINAIRTSHYPNNSFFYELADQYGFYVIDEMNLESHGLWDQVRFFQRPVEEAVPGDDPRWLPTLMDRAANMFERDKNHPSIVMWSCGNESFGGTDILAVADYFREVDNRPVHYEGVHWDPRYPETTDVVSQMYTPAAEVEEFLKTHRNKPMILCEYAHAMGNSFGAVDRYVDLAYREPLFQGGFIWDFADQAIKLKDRYGQEFFGYGGDCGESPHDGDFCGNGIFFADHSPTPRIQEVKYLYQGLITTIGSESFTVENRFLFTSSRDFECRVTLAREGVALDNSIVPTDVGPGQTHTYALPLSIPSNAGEYTITVSFHLRQGTPWADTGYEIAAEQAVFEVGNRQPVKATGSPEIIVGTHNIGVRGKHFHILFSRLHGGLASYKWAGKELFNSPPVPNFWHAPTSNETAWKAPAEDGQWLLASRYAIHTPSLDNPRVSQEDNKVCIAFTYDLPTTPPSSCTTEYRVDGDGRVEATIDVIPGEGLGDMPEFGMLFTSSADLDQFRWYGEGPDECYVDRRGGARLGIYQSTVAEQFTPYLVPQECGNHTGVRWAEVTDTNGIGIRFEGHPTMEFSALPWSPFEIENSTHAHKLPPIHHTYMRPALMRRGVAGDDTWGARPHPEFLLPTGKLSFTFAFQGIG